ncbi:hypothetical protein BU16DRAFT_64196 [Lophium mytilinum]|uniref:Uncharacterized protein n=1 Tax=Lophium mytilinum TaxID=390894 RepID=A0A6A6QQS4_9PEZI|nr:hypothetical protein BU16DRAFT_64196 [Lophium mytilinum]
MIIVYLGLVLYILSTSLTQITNLNQKSLVFVELDNSISAIPPIPPSMFPPLPDIALSSAENPEHCLLLSTDEHIINPIVELYEPIDGSAPEDSSTVVTTSAETQRYWQLIHPGSFDRYSSDKVTLNANLGPWGWTSKAPAPSPTRDERLQELKEMLIPYAKTTQGRREAERVIADYKAELFEDCTCPEDINAANEYLQEIEQSWQYCKDMNTFDEQYSRKTNSESIQIIQENRGPLATELANPMNHLSVQDYEKIRDGPFEDLKNELRDRAKTLKGRVATEALLQRFKDELYESRESPADIKAAEDYLREVEMLWETFKFGRATQGPQKRTLNLWPSRKLAAIIEDEDDEDDDLSDFEDDDEHALTRVSSRSS